VLGGRSPSLHASKLFLWQSSFGLLSSVHHLEFRNPGADHSVFARFVSTTFVFRFITATVAATVPPGSRCSDVFVVLKNVLSSIIGLGFFKSQFLIILLLFYAHLPITVIRLRVRFS